MTDLSKRHAAQRAQAVELPNMIVTIWSHGYQRSMVEDRRAMAVLELDPIPFSHLRLRYLAQVAQSLRLTEIVHNLQVINPPKVNGLLHLPLTQNYKKSTNKPFRTMRLVLGATMSVQRYSNERG